MTLNPAATLATVPPCPQDAVPMQPTLGELPFGTVQKVGDYKILGILGSGGMGIVYKAFDQKLGRIVALKMLQIGVEAGPEELLRFRGEAETLGRLQHPNIVQVFDFGIHEKSPFLVMEYVNGGGLDKKLQGTPQPPRRAAELIEQLARAIHVAHQAHIIHRDLKPANVLLTAEGLPKITDFGLAKQTEVTSGLTQTGAIMGTPSYMAPEQAQGKKDVGPGADIYSLGAILYEMLTGRPPFRGATLQETLEQVCVEDPAPPSRLVPRLPRDLQTICLKCLHKIPARRYLTAADLADDLKNWLEGLPVKARPTHSIERLYRIVARKPMRAAMALAGLLLLGLSIVLTIVVREKAADQQHRELERKADEDRRNHEEQLREQKRQQAEQIREQNRQKELHAQALKNLQDILELALGGELRTPAGMKKLTDRLASETKKLETRRESDASVKLLPLAQVYYKIVPRVWQRGTGHKEAIDLLNRAETLLRGDLKNHPNDVEIRFLLAQIHAKRGEVLTDSGGVSAELLDNDRQAAEKDFTAALSELDGLRGARLDEHKCEQVRGEALHNLGTLLSKDPDPASGKKALKFYHDALAVRLKLVRRKEATDRDTRDLARTYGYLGDLHQDLGELREADRTYWASHQLREDLARNNPRDLEAQLQLARSWWNFGDYQRRQKSLTTSRYFHEQALKILEDIHKKQPDNQTFTEDLSSVLNRIAELELLIASAQPEARLERVRTLLARGEELLRELLKELGESERTPIGIRSAHAENIALKARMLLLAGKPIEKEPWKALVAAYEPLKDRCPRDDKGKLNPAKDITPSELYTYAAIMALFAESSRASTSADRVRDALQLAFAKGYTRLHPDDIARDRAFDSMQKDEKFLALMAEQRKKMTVSSEQGKTP